MTTILSAEGRRREPWRAAATARCVRVGALIAGAPVPGPVIPPCLRIGDALFPAVRHESARRLRAAGRTQVEIAELLGISQGMVSKYLRNDRPAVPEDMAWLVDAMADGIARGTMDVPPPEADGADAMHVDPWCVTINEWAGGPAGDGEAIRWVFRDVAGLLGRIAHEVPARLVPAVNINIAGAAPDARAPDEVVAYPGRLALVAGQLRAHGPPALGASSHLAALLLAAGRSGPRVRFVVNLRNDEVIRQALRSLGEVVVEMDAAVRDEAGVCALDARDVGGSAYVALDPGGVGIEPAAYMLDEDAGSLAERLVRLAQRVGSR